MSQEDVFKFQPIREGYGPTVGYLINIHELSFSYFVEVFLSEKKKQMAEFVLILIFRDHNSKIRNQYIVHLFIIFYFRLLGFF